jgi:hypothetical protein
MNCTVKQRNKARRVIHQLGDRSDVIGTDLISPAIDPSGQWAIEIALDTEGLPPAIIELLAQAEMTIRDVGPRQSWWHCVAIV